MKATSTFSLKDQLFNSEKVDFLAGQIARVFPAFSHGAFHQDVVSAFPRLELKERIAHMTGCLHTHLPDAYPVALDILLRALPPELDPGRTDDDFGDFIFAPFSLYVATHGCSPKYLDISLPALKEMTKRFSVEYAIRFFINAFPEETFIFLTECVADAHYHVRRLASEGSRPKLPWAQKLETDFRRPLPILDALYADSTRYVTRSVANHLNDISKLSPDLVVETLKRWRKSRAQKPKEMDFITKHALRTLVKQGHREALALLGFGGRPDVTIDDFSTTTPEVKIGETLEFSVTLSSNKDQNLVVDYLMQFAGDGGKGGKKVFKLKQLDLGEGQVVTLNKKHPMRLMTTRRLFPGRHEIFLQINGQPFGSIGFELVV